MAQRRISDAEIFPALCRENFDFFLRKAFAELEGGEPYQHNWHIDAIIHELDRIRLGENTRLITTMPPRHLKTFTITTAWVPWMLGRNPSLRFICASYGENLAVKPAADCLRIMESDWYREAFPQLRLTRRTTLDFETSMGGGRLSTSVGGVLTGRGAHIVIIDDPMKADDAYSEAARQDVRDWYHRTLRSRLEDQEKSAIILVMQRLHEADLAGELLSLGNYHELRLSGIATHDELIPLTRGRFYQRRTGHALHPARQSLASLLERRAEEPIVFAAQVQQDPMPYIGAFIDPAWFGTYDTEPWGTEVILSMDTAVKTTVRSDWSVGIVATYYRGHYYILDVFRERVTFPELLSAVAELCRKYKVSRLLIEDASSGQELIQMLRNDLPDGVPLPIAVRPHQDKITRFEAQASKIQAGAVILPRAAPWHADFIKEVVGFPNARHDDQADALIQMLANPPIEMRYGIADYGAELIEIGGNTMCDYDEYDDPWLP